MTEMTSNDPDGIKPCYSDHREDIRVYGNCTVCGSDDLLVVGHILPAVPRRQGLNPVQAAREVHDSQTMTMVDGILLDTFTASAILAVHERLSEFGQAKLEAMGLVQAADACFRLMTAPGS